MTPILLSLALVAWHPTNGVTSRPVPTWVAKHPTPAPHAVVPVLGARKPTFGVVLQPHQAGVILAIPIR